MMRRALPLLLTMASGLALAGQASAATGFGLLPAAFTTAIALPVQPGCAGAGPATGQLAAGASPFSKASAILGGEPSQLERIMRQQASAPSAGLVPAPASPSGPVAGVAGCSGSAQFTFGQPAITRMAPGLALPRPARTVGPDDFLSSRRLPVSHTSFDAQWARVNGAALPGGLVRGLPLGSGNGGQLARIKAVNAWANGRIRYVEDRDLYRQADFWADARTTLRLRAGDCEDIAILKMQLLAAAGVPRDAMFLTIARDLARNADHALLVVRDGGTFWLLDNATNTLIDANAAIDYRPIMSFNQKGKWLHGY